MKNDIEQALDQSSALLQITKDMLEQKKQEVRLLFIALIVSICANLVIVGAFLWYESTWDYTTTETTKSETKQVLDGNGNNNLVNGDQYNDKSVNQSGGKKDGN